MSPLRLSAAECFVHWRSVPDRKEFRAGTVQREPQASPLLLLLLRFEKSRLRLASAACVVTSS
jgi:hypothetical protein